MNDIKIYKTKRKIQSKQKAATFQKTKKIHSKTGELVVLRVRVRESVSVGSLRVPPNHKMLVLTKCVQTQTPHLNRIVLTF